MLMHPIGIFGGTFDPIHYGHLRLAEEAREQCGLAEVRFIPSGTPPHRAAPQAGAADRLAMVQLALAGQPGFVADAREVERTDPCYSVQTLAALRAEVGTARPLCWLLGSDAFLQLHRWWHWRELFDLAHLVVIQRPGQPLGNAMLKADAELLAEYRARLVPAPLALRETAAGGIAVLEVPLLEIAATDLRRRIEEGRSLRYLLPDAVLTYLQTHSVYPS